MASTNKFLRDLKDNLMYRAIGPSMRKILREEFSELRKFNEILYALHSRTYLDRPKLIELRNSPVYQKPFIAKNPLVSIRVATYSRAKILTERTIPSFLNQTYKNIEIVVVGDRCIDDTEEQIKKIKDKSSIIYHIVESTPKIL
jgi:cellulose synthase/poly-beta-1,6-N-acetylglucosamine synthase-like glycosyltransferase